jgi:hypothetical protein
MSEFVIDPFTPGVPVYDPKKFIGREDQVNSVIHALYQTSKNNSVNLIISGDRGIGKSSLLHQCLRLAAGDNSLSNELNIPIGVKQYSFIIYHYDADKDQTPAHLVEGWLSQIKSSFSKIFGKIEIELEIPYIGKMKAREKSLDKTISDIASDFSDKLRSIASNLGDKSGLILSVDELDRVDSTSGFATFFKLLTETLARNNCRNIMIMASGISGAIQNLEEEHASINRTFKEIPLSRLTYNESRGILKKGFDSVDFQILDDVCLKCHEYAAGFPELIHLFGSGMLKIGRNKEIKMHDFNAAFDQILTNTKKNHLDGILRTVGFNRGQDILKAMASLPAVCTLSDIGRMVGEDNNAISPYLKDLVTKNVIKRVDRAVYSFVDPMLKEYIKVFGVLKVEVEEE